VFYVQESRFAVFDLRFDCRYSVSLQPVSRDGITGHVTRLSVTPPPCRQVAVVGSVRPDCPPDAGVFLHETPLQRAAVLFVRPSYPVLELTSRAGGRHDMYPPLQVDL